ncbi:MAG TPA: hypothetical protein PLF15_00535 [bacterium]|nr:hypothetical protein [bacterium]
MFDKNKNQNFAKEVEKITATDKSPEILAGITTETKYNPDNIRVHAMPEKFLALGHKKTIITGGGDNSSRAPAGGVKKNIIIGLIIGFLIITLLALAAWFLIKSLEGPAVEENNQPNNEQTPAENIIPPVPTSTPTTTEELMGCSADSCEFCGQEECQQLIEYCHWADLCQESTATTTDGCPIFQCFAGALEQKFNEDNLENLTFGQDSDNDLLTDVEEGLWGANPLNSDTDGDSYLDGEELKNLYSPTEKSGAAKSKLSNGQTIKIFTNNQFGYTVFYPAGWQENSLGESANNIMFTSQSGEFFQVIVESNTDNFATAKEWYLQQDNNLMAEDLQEVLIGNWSGVRSPDGLNVYLIKDEYLYTLTYNVGLKNELSYRTTFEMFLKSFHLFESPLE